MGPGIRLKQKGSLQLKRELAMQEMQMKRGWPGEGVAGVSGVYVGGEPG